jgi:hypothetical protein
MKRKKEKVKAKSFDKLRGFKRIDFRTEFMNARREVS